MSVADIHYRVAKPNKGKNVCEKQEVSMSLAERFLHRGISALQEVNAQVAEIPCYLVFHATVISP